MAAGSLQGRSSTPHHHAPAHGVYNIRTVFSTASAGMCHAAALALPCCAVPDSASRHYGCMLPSHTCTRVLPGFGPCLRSHSSSMTWQRVNESPACCCWPEDRPYLVHDAGFCNTVTHLLLRRNVDRDNCAAPQRRKTVHQPQCPFSCSSCPCW